jgi:hypothetical protein
MTPRQDKFGVHDKRLVLAQLAGRTHLSRSRDASISDFRSAVNQSPTKLAEHSDDLLNEILQDGLLVSTVREFDLATCRSKNIWPQSFC